MNSELEKVLKHYGYRKDASTFMSSLENLVLDFQERSKEEYFYDEYLEEIGFSDRGIIESIGYLYDDDSISMEEIISVFLDFDWIDIINLDQDSDSYYFQDKNYDDFENDELVNYLINLDPKKSGIVEVPYMDDFYFVFLNDSFYTQSKNFMKEYEQKVKQQNFEIYDIARKFLSDIENEIDAYLKNEGYELDEDFYITKIDDYDSSMYLEITMDSFLESFKIRISDHSNQSNLHSSAHINLALYPLAHFLTGDYSDMLDYQDGFSDRPMSEKQVLNAFIDFYKKNS